MKVLYVVGTCLSRNTSANISHNAFVQGLLENGCKVDILMARSSWGQEDAGMPAWKDATYYTYNAVSWTDRLRDAVRRQFDRGNGLEHGTPVSDGLSDSTEMTPTISLKTHMRKLAQKAYRACFRKRLYQLEVAWLKRAVRFRSDVDYNLIVSNSSPAASHRLVMELLSRKRISGRRWIQIWEDPWYYDLYGGHTVEEKQEEHLLLRASSEIFYVSPLTLYYQKKNFPDCSDKMKYIPLPFLKMDEGKKRRFSVLPTFGYFGDYYSKTRNLMPFYQALRKSGARGYVYGDSDLALEPTNNIEVCGRVTLDKLTNVQERTDILVHLCNLRGGQIPGKIYHYSATTKPILFILDGVEEEVSAIRECFEKYQRYHFCKNNEEDISIIIESFVAGHEKMEEQPVEDFQPSRVVSQLIRS